MNCPCQSGENYDLCCGRFISHQALAENALLLMRSRFSAYALNELDYLRETWHQQYRPLNLQIDDGIKWLNLIIIDYSSQDIHAEVEFEALMLVNQKVEVLHEKSQFLLENGQWLYTTGEMMQPLTQPFKPGRNDSCPCNSGLKFKRCCGK